MTYTDTVARLAEATEAELLAAQEDPTVDFTPYAVALLTRARARAVALADAALAVELTALWAVPVLPLGLAPPPPPPTEEVRAAEAGPPSVAALAVGVLARATVLAAARAAYADASARHGVLTWTREANAGACPACMDLADGTDLSITTPMWTHKGCGCAARPTS